MFLRAPGESFASFRLKSLLESNFGLNFRLTSDAGECRVLLKGDREPEASFPSAPNHGKRGCGGIEHATVTGKVEESFGIGSEVGLLDEGERVATPVFDHGEQRRHHVGHHRSQLVLRQASAEQWGSAIDLSDGGP